jgi:hypothetical protein
MVYPIIYRVSTIQGGAGFRNHQQYVSIQISGSGNFSMGKIPLDDESVLCWGSQTEVPISRRFLYKLVCSLNVIYFVVAC